jgi:tryptophan-rich sensory protein
VLCFAVAATGALFPIDQWFDELSRPSWAPPNYVFGPVWTVLYLCMAVSAWLVWRQDGLQHATLPLTMFLVQLALNAAWSWLFFGLHRIDWAMLDIVLLLVAIVLTMVLFARRNRVASALLVPYLLWVTFATALNFAYLRLNG